MILQKQIGCGDCREQWIGYCPLCKKIATRVFIENGKRVRGDRIPIEARPTIQSKTVSKIKVNNLIPKPNKKPTIKKSYSDEKKRLLKKHPKKVVQLIMRGHKEGCACCPRVSDLTFDHIIPISRGGKDNLANGQILCSQCNTVKDSRIISIEELKKEILHNRCCGRCDGVNDECVGDRNCEAHDVKGCETCFGLRGWTARAIYDNRAHD